MNILDQMKEKNPFPALLDGTEDGAYPKSELGYIRAYFDRNAGCWFNSCFHVGEFKKTLASELDDIYTMFKLVFPTVGKMRDWCKNNLGTPKEWCGYDEYHGYMQTPIGFYHFIMRTAPGDYNLYLHCYDRYLIPWSDDNATYDRAYENYECGDEVFNTEYLDFDVSMEKSKLLKIYAELQKVFNGDVVTYPDTGDEKYIGNFGEFIRSCNGKEGFSRTNDDVDHLDFAL